MGRRVLRPPCRLPQFLCFLNRARDNPALSVSHYNPCGDRLQEFFCASIEKNVPSGNQPVGRCAYVGRALCVFLQYFFRCPDRNVSFPVVFGISCYNAVHFAEQRGGVLNRILKITPCHIQRVTNCLFRNFFRSSLLYSLLCVCRRAI